MVRKSHKKVGKKFTDTVYASSIATLKQLFRKSPLNRTHTLGNISKVSRQKGLFGKHKYRQHSTHERKRNREPDGLMR